MDFSRAAECLGARDLTAGRGSVDLEVVAAAAAINSNCMCASVSG